MSDKQKSNIRLYIEAPLSAGQKVTLDVRRSHYICNVMRLQEGDMINCFNGKDGEFECRLALAHKKESVLDVVRQTRKMIGVPDIWLLFAPVKKDCTDFIIEKAVELGARKICPVITRYTINKETRLERFCAQAVEASEQCRRVEVPEVLPSVSLEKILASWDKKRKLFFMDETGGGKTAVEVFQKNKGCPAAVLVGPEGGFAAEELALLRRLDFAEAVSLGPRILRAETAVAAALAVWQATAGDWDMVKEN